MKTVGVLRYQGDFEKHLAVLDEVGVRALPVRTVTDLLAVDALVIPGGESTTIGMLMDRFGLLPELRRLIGQGFPVLGTCAGTILLADSIEASDQIRVGGMDIVVRRNAYGRQIDSFEADIEAPELGTEPVRCVFIRAPKIVSVGLGVRILASYDDHPVAVVDGKLMALTFHPELTNEYRFHRLFVETFVEIRR